MIEKIYDQDLLKEMLEYASFNSKAYRIYILCIAHGHFDLAMNIRRKYNIEPPIKESDLTIALKWSLEAAKSSKPESIQSPSGTGEDARPTA